MNHRTWGRCSLLFIIHSLLLIFPKYAAADGTVGCIYSESLCSEKERCFNDHAFGRCVFKHGYSVDELYRFEFKFDELGSLKEQLEQLIDLGFTWKHPFTQCVVQTQLYSIKTGVSYNADFCDQLLKKVPEAVDPIRILQYEQLRDHPQEKHSFTELEHEGVFEQDPTANRGTNVKYSHLKQPDYEHELLNELRSQSKIKKADDEYTASRYRGTPLYTPVRNRVNKIKIDANMVDDATEQEEESSRISEVESPNLANREDILAGLMALQKALDVVSDKKNQAFSEGGPVILSDQKEDYDSDDVYNKIIDQYSTDLFGFQRRERLDVKKPGPYYKVNNYAFEKINAETLNDDGNVNYHNSAESKPKGKMTQRSVYSESYPKYQRLNYEYPEAYRSYQTPTASPYVTIETNTELSESSVSQMIGKLIKILNFSPGIFRNSRIAGNKLTFTVRRNILGLTPSDVIRRIDELKYALKFEDGIKILRIYSGMPKEDKDPNESNSDDSEDDTNQYALVDTDYAYIELKEPVADGSGIIKKIESLLELPEDTLYGTKNRLYQISFKVGPNRQGLNASELAKKIDSMRSKIKDKLNIDITSVGIGDKDKLPTATRISGVDENLYMVTFVVCGVVGAVLISAGILFYIKKNKKANSLYRASDKEQGREYQTAKTNKITIMEVIRTKSQGKPGLDGSTAAQRITSLSKESDNSPSSRSSTSSWSEEPMSNMDISTGHMIWEYMEKHKNDTVKLDAEWAALCAYDSDPSSVSVGQAKENLYKNRYINALPYDHARVVLNAMSNVSGSDYINASTITDHDPRTPMYIATQGPLQNTVCDFWQMVWEQGCVVIVMLTRLVEHDANLCYRYWPQEGVDVYNIYEVHLVSEHIWCDDFLVRSFYLKNLKTTETRTVTQFHYLTWPEGGVPTAVKPLLEFRRKVNKSFRGRSCPIVVHCSDGVGRTGTYLLLDLVLNRIAKGAREIDVAATLEHVRDQRAGAVCTKAQFIFVLHAVAEEVQAALKALPQQPQYTQEEDNAIEAQQPTEDK